MLSHKLLASGEVYLDDYYVPDNNAAEAFDNPTSISWNSTRGYYKDTTSTTRISVSIPNLETNRAFRVTATITGYYNQPDGCQGTSRLRVYFSDGTLLFIGTNDGWGSNSSGQERYLGDAGNPPRSTTNVNQKTYTATAPEGEYITSVEFESYKRSTGAPAANRGIKNIRVEYYNS